MITFIILGVLIITAIIMYRKSFNNYDDIREYISIAIIVFAGTYLLFHTVFFSMKSYDYELFVEERSAFEETLKNSRENGCDLETATIVKEVSEWNVLLANCKYKNKTLFFDQYIDDRIETLNPIK